MSESRKAKKKTRKVRYLNLKTRRIEIREEEIKEPQVVSSRLAFHLKEEDQLAKRLEPRSKQERFETFLKDKLLMGHLSRIKKERTGKGGYEKTLMNNDYPDSMPEKQIIEDDSGPNRPKGKELRW